MNITLTSNNIIKRLAIILDNCADFQVGKMVHSMKMGWMKTPTERKKELEEAQKDTQVFYDIWSNEDEVFDVILPIHLRIRTYEIYTPKSVFY